MMYIADEMTQRIQDLFQIKYPIIQAGMVWCSGWKLALAVHRAGGLGMIGAGSMNTEVLEHHLQQLKQHCKGNFAVNLPLLYSKVEDQIDLLLKYEVPIVFTSAGSPKLYTRFFQEHGIKVVHVVSSLKFALKSQEAGVDAVVAEGFEAGGHNGREETTTLCLLEMLYGKLNIPLIAAGGIGSGRAMLACEILGAEGFQIGSLFAAASESSAHENFKKALIDAQEGDTILTLKEITPVRLLKNAFYKQVEEAYSTGAGKEELIRILGKGRSRKGILEGQIDEGELEIGQIAATIQKIDSAAEIMNRLMTEYQEAKERMKL